MSRLKIFAIALMLMPMAGCLEHIASIDKHTFTSRPHQPTTITLVDTTNSEEFWQMDVPVCTRLVMDFDRPPEAEGFYNNLNPASILNWKLLPLDSNDPIDEGRCYLSGCRPFLMKVTYRNSPEVPETDPGMLRPCPDCPTQGSQTAHYVAPSADAAPAQAEHQAQASTVFVEDAGYGQAQQTQVVAQYQPITENELVELPEGQ